MAAIPCRDWWRGRGRDAPGIFTVTHLWIVVQDEPGEGWIPTIDRQPTGLHRTQAASSRAYGMSADAALEGWDA